MSSLREITDSLSDLFLELEANFGELTPAMEAELERLNSDRAAKVQGIVRWCRMQLRYAKAQKEEAREFTMMAGRRLRAAENLEAHLVAEMQRLGQKEIRCGAFAVSLARIGIPRMGSDHISLIPGIFSRVVPERLEFDKKAALKWFKSLHEMPFNAGLYTVSFENIRKPEVREFWPAYDLPRDPTPLHDEFTLEVRERLQVK
jgi:hypothetical protein